MSRLYLSNPCALLFFLHTVLRAQSAPGFPCALCSRRDNDLKSSDKSCRENENACPVITGRTVGWAKRSVPTFASAPGKVGTAQRRLCPPYEPSDPYFTCVRIGLSFSPLLS